ncbi:gamma-glutamyl hydrolase A-like protein [Sarcoptes scabiei]|uniref:folate gamma-glutamyl hydrolase n=1 Tax=Sarcoptes scabiei TaxID=52283 RepID=A0A132A0W6_SARSC|nr:gamma-glutamyl hydrolase A-like protein [Sarcoptes scabiei]
MVEIRFRSNFGSNLSVWLFKFISLTTLTLISSYDCCQNDRVVVGVLAQFLHHSNRQYIAASYVKQMESSGARVVPVFVGRNEEYYRNLMSKINGILLPGGGSPLTHGPYADAMDKIITIALEMNQNGTYFPVWATCLSFEKLILNFMQTKNDQWKSMCHVQNISLNLEIEKSVLDDPSQTKMFHEMNETIPWNRFKNYTFVSTIEHIKFPIFGSAWHPEKSQFEFVVGANVGNINHDRWAILASQYFSNFFINECRKNCGHFVDKLEESQHLIYNYVEYLEYIGNDPKSSIEERYHFPESCNKAHLNPFSFEMFKFLSFFVIIYNLFSL